MNDHLPPVSDAHLNAFLIRLLHQIADNKTALPAFSGGIWLTYRHLSRLRPFSLSASLDPGLVAGHTFPEVLSTLAYVLSSPHGHVLCHSMLEPGATGAAAIGQTMFYDPEARHLFTPKPVLIGVLVQLDGRELVLKCDPATGLTEPADPETNLITVTASTWAIAEAIDNMMNAPLPEDAGQLALEVLDRQPSLALESGRTITASGSNIPGTMTNALAREFVKRATTAAAAENQRHRPPVKTTRLTVGEDPSVVVSAYTKASIDKSQVVTRTYRTVE